MYIGVTMANVEIEGLSELNKKLKGLGNIKHNKSLLAGAIKLQEISQRYSPVDTGFLRSSHSSRETKDGAEMVVSAEYAVYLHEGTKYIRGREWITNAMDIKEQEILNAVATVEKKLVESEVK